MCMLMVGERRAGRVDVQSHRIASTHRCVRWGESDGASFDLVPCENSHVRTIARTCECATERMRSHVRRNACVRTCVGMHAHSHVRMRMHETDAWERRQPGGSPVHGLRQCSSRSGCGSPCLGRQSHSSRRLCEESQSRVAEGSVRRPHRYRHLGRPAPTGGSESESESESERPNATLASS